MELGVAFYRGPGGFVNWLIRRWTRSVYSHVELVLPDAEGHLGIRPWEDGVVKEHKRIDADDDHWDIVTFTVELPQLLTIQQFYERTRGQGYDWLAVILNHTSPLQIKQIGKWYCSEWVAHALVLAGVARLGAQEYLNPGCLHRALLEPLQGDSETDVGPQQHLA